METVNALKDKFPQLISPPSDDICYDTQNRQLAVKQMGAEADLVIVVGSRNSSNSMRLVEVAKLAGADAAYLVDFADEIEETWPRFVSGRECVTGLLFAPFVPRDRGRGLRVSLRLPPSLWQAPVHRLSPLADQKVIGTAEGP